MCFFSGVEATPGTRRKWAAVGTDSEPTVQPASTGAPAKPTKWVVNLRGTWMRLDQPLDGPARGLIVHLTSYGGYEYEKPILNEMRARGWAVLWVDSSTVKPETTYIDVDPANLGSAAQRIAQNISDRVSEIAYAVEGGLEYIEKEHPEIPHSPTIIMGYSAGALATPTVVSLMPDRFDAAVLVGGGANLLDISQRSALTDGGLKLRWSRTPTAADKDQLESLYLENCRLDPYWTSQSLRDKPVLLLHAVLDRIVPASDGDLLYARLGRPERVNFLLGHELLFLRLGSQTRKIADWVDNVADTSTVVSR
jgi:predicted esterase